MSKLDELIAEEDRLRTEWQIAKVRLDEAEHATLVERFKDMEQFEEGDIVLVQRKLFGKIKWWPARIVGVHLTYHEGTTKDGRPWETKVIAYTVFLKQADGDFGGTSDSYYHTQVQAVPEEAVA